MCEYGFETGHLLVYCSSSGGWGDDRLGDGEMIVSIRVIPFYGMGRWSPSFLVKEERTGEIDLGRERERDGHLHCHYSSLRG